MKKIFILILLTACSQLGDTTTVATATGGVVGAGLGAIIGNQTGDAGAGIAIGALAGAGTGAAIGSAISGQNEKINNQDEKIKRQERLIQSQRSELAEIRKVNQDDSIPTKKIAKPVLLPKAKSIDDMTQETEKIFNQSEDISINKKEEARKKISKMNEKTKVEKIVKKEDKKLEKKVLEKEIKVDEVKEDVKAVEEKPEVINEKIVAEVSGSECQEAQKEATLAESAADTADKLFHYRRALRLCPDKANFHSSLAKVYQSLNRNDDAEFELKEAARLEGNK